MTLPPASRAKFAKVRGPQPKTPPEDETLVGRLIKHRKAKGWTQEEAAKHMAMSVNSLRAYERQSRKPNGAATLKILDFLGALK